MSRKAISSVNSSSKPSVKGINGKAPVDATVRPSQPTSVPTSTATTAVPDVAVGATVLNGQAVVMVPVAVRTPQLPTHAVGATLTGLTSRQVRVLNVLAAAATPLTRKQLQTATRQVKGWSRLLGASSKGAAFDTLAGRGMVNVSPVAPFEYTITQQGLEAVGTATKPLPMVNATQAPAVEPTSTPAIKGKGSKGK